MELIAKIRAEIISRLDKRHLSTQARNELVSILSFLDTLQEPAKRGYKDCNGCEYNRTLKDQIGWQFQGCFGGDYKGKPIAEIELCPLKVAALQEQEVKEQKSQDTVGRVSVEIRSNLQTDEVVRKTLIMLVNDGRISVTGAITSSDILNWLEGQKDPDVDLEKEIDKTVYECTDGYNFDWDKFARHFYNLGKNAK